MNWGRLISMLLPGAARLAYEALSAIVAGDWEKAARKAEEAGRRQASRLAADAVLAEKAKGKKA